MQRDYMKMTYEEKQARHKKDKKAIQDFEYRELKSKFYKTKDDMKRLAELERQQSFKQVEAEHSFVLFILIALIIIVVFLICAIYF